MPFKHVVFCRCPITTWMRQQEAVLNVFLVAQRYVVYNDSVTNTHDHVVSLQMPHYHLEEATEAVKPVLGAYYREPMASKGPIPFHLLEPLARSFKEDHYVADEGDIVYYQKDPELVARVFKA